MGSSYEARCRRCRAQFRASHGGGFTFHLLHCDTCGRERDVSLRELGDVHFAYMKTLRALQAAANPAQTRDMQETYAGKPISREQYEAEIERIAGSCDCGGEFRLEAPPRCPNCRSLKDSWDPIEGSRVNYD